MMKWTHWILYLICLPWDLFVAWPVVLLIRLFWGEELRWEKPPPYTREHGGGGGWVLTCKIRKGSFPVTEGTWPKGWYLRTGKDGKKRSWGGTALGHGIFYGANVNRVVRSAGEHTFVKWLRVQAHEHIHVEQAEVAMLRAFIVGLVSGIVLLALGHPLAALFTFLGIWTAGYLMMGVAGWLTAVLRGEPHYWGSTHEESARAQDDALVE
jgi:hypothetical protein